MEFWRYRFGGLGVFGDLWFILNFQGKWECGYIIHGSEDQERNPSWRQRFGLPQHIDGN